MKLVTLLTVLVFALSLSAVSVLADDGELTPKDLQKFRDAAESKGNMTLLINAVTNNKLKDLTLNRELLNSYDNRFNVKLDGTKISSQKSTGRCWMFAGANLIGPKVMTALELSDFQLSRSYLSFYDKLEKANLFMETMIRLRERPVDDRVLLMYLESPIGDGGWFTYFEGLIEKYGVVPASVMPETKQSDATREVNGLLNKLMRKATAEIRHRAEDGAKVKELRAYKEEVLGDVYRLLLSAYGYPPSEFVFRYEKENEEDSTKNLVEESYTPKSFFAKFYGDDMPEYVAFSNVPARDYGQPYILEDVRNMVGLEEVVVLNEPIEKLKHYAMKSLVDSQLVWFACDVGQDRFTDSGFLAPNIHQYDVALGIDFEMTKADRVRYDDISPNHAMVLTGVDTLTDGTPRKWKIENSWGSKSGDNGYWTMADDWFDKWVLIVIVDKRLLEPEDVALFEKKPVPVEDWEPFFQGLTRIQ